MPYEEAALHGSVTIREDGERLAVDAGNHGSWDILPAVCKVTGKVRAVLPEHASGGTGARGELGSRRTD
jgi:hypothetical protein